MVLTILRADMYRALRSPSLLIALVAVAVLSGYSAFSLFASASGVITPSLILLSPGSGPAVSDGIPSITESVGSLGLSGGFLPVVSSLAVTLFVAQGLQSGYYGGLVSAGASRSSLILVTLVVSLASSSALLAACFVPYFAGYAVMGILPLSEFDSGTLFFWLILADLHVFLYSFLAGCVTVVARRRVAGLVVALVVSTGILEMLLVAALQSMEAFESAAAMLIPLLPDSIVEALCQPSAVLYSQYIGSAALQVVATAVYALLAVSVGGISSALCRKISIL